MIISISYFQTLQPASTAGDNIQEGHVQEHMNCIINLLPRYHVEAIRQLHASKLNTISFPPPRADKSTQSPHQNAPSQSFHLKPKPPRQNPISPPHPSITLVFLPTHTRPSPLLSNSPPTPPPSSLKSSTCPSISGIKWLVRNV